MGRISFLFVHSFVYSTIISWVYFQFPHLLSLTFQTIYVHLKVSLGKKFHQKCIYKSANHTIDWSFHCSMEKSVIRALKQPVTLWRNIQGQLINQWMILSINQSRNSSIMWFNVSITESMKQSRIVFHCRWLPALNCLLLLVLWRAKWQRWML